MRASAIAAVDAAENNILSKAPKNIEHPGMSQGITPGGGVGAAGGIGMGVVSGDTELSSELASFPNLGTALKLVSLQGISLSLSLSLPLSLTVHTLTFYLKP
jgi:hypothetical protein